ncbi:ABC transporter ATP-binding protein [Hoeflea prorocentri]|uniref:ABC transporter ATP-binding protein n=1 Tax=Hoeflea prorocentri TaxID=1922333 RepID=A0A9X3ZI63_9HYPH|nr:ABC transporter ATP-binding protein [Hoeflea prorocentri]MCY6382602.1 ABC transporter ATP-binding protein [Hoeflea prorocentri]MDA5400402.1 ABC transporter ATP-binding protein [Hoeflea prorocentri]
MTDLSHALLETRSVSVSFGAFKAVDAVSLKVTEGSITGLIGPNGAGKSTLFNAIAGEQACDSGEIRFDGSRIDGLASNDVHGTGLARTFQIPKPFAAMSVLENLMLAAPDQPGEQFWVPVIARGRIAAREREILERAHEILAFTTLEGVASEAAGQLSGGQQKLLELARVLMSSPKMIMLDEPAAGVNPTLTGVLIEKIEQLNADGCTFLIIEHDMDLVMRHCDTIVAMTNGRIIYEGDAAGAQSNEMLLNAYLGAGADG